MHGGGRFFGTSGRELSLWLSSIGTRGFSARLFALDSGRSHNARLGAGSFGPGEQRDIFSGRCAGSVPGNGRAGKLEVEHGRRSRPPTGKTLRPRSRPASAHSLEGRRAIVCSWRPMPPGGAAVKEAPRSDRSLMQHFVRRRNRLGARSEIRGRIRRPEPIHACSRFRRFRG